MGVFKTSRVSNKKDHGILGSALVHAAGGNFKAAQTLNPKPLHGK